MNDLIDRPLQRRARRGARYLVVLGCVLIDLDLSRNSGIFPFYMYGLPRLHIDSLILFVQRIAFSRFQLTQIKPSGHRQIVDVDIALIIRRIFADGLLAGVIEDKLDPIYAFFRNTVDLMDDNAAEGLIGHGEGGGLVILYGKVVRRAVHLEALRGLDLHRVVVPGLQLDICTALAVRGHSVHQPAVHLSDLKGDIGDALRLIRLVDLDDLHAASPLVEEGELLRLPLLDEDALRRAIQHEPVHRFGLLRCDGDAGLQILQNDLTVAVRDKLPVAGTEERPGAVGDQEGNAGKRLVVRPLDVLLNGEGGAGDVVEGQCLGVLRVHGHGLGLRPRVNGIARDGLRLLDHDSPGDPADANLAIGVGGIQPLTGQVPVGVVHIAALSVGQFKLHAGQRLAGQLVQLPNHQGPLLLVVEPEGLHLALFDLDRLGRAVQDVALHRLDLPGGNGLTWLQPMDLDLTGFICDELPVALPNRFARPRGDQEGHTLQRRCRALNVFLNHERRIRGVVEGQRLGILRVDSHSLCLCPRVDGIARDSLRLLDHDGAGDTADADLSIFIGGV